MSVRRLLVREHDAVSQQLQSAYGARRGLCDGPYRRGNFGLCGAFLARKVLFLASLMLNDPKSLELDA
jgi:hypothetical protein